MTFTKDIQEEIENKVLTFTVLYHEAGDAAIRKSLNCDVLIQSNHSPSLYYALRRNDCFYFSAQKIDAEIEKLVQGMKDGSPEELEARRFRLQDAARQEVKNRVIDYYVSTRTA